MSTNRVYKVIFSSQGEVYEIYAREIYQGEMFGFVEVEEIVFGERSAVLVDPSEERLKTEFANVKRTYIPMHTIIRIDEVEKEGVSKITPVSGSSSESKITSFPGYIPPGGDSGKK
ncbi:MAG: DUF1820 family protein [Gammaproteobacteria bacterium]|nr:DUF1820 family protein [Gammaproteobacteria bacterium]